MTEYIIASKVHNNRCYTTEAVSPVFVSASSIYVLPFKHVMSSAGALHRPFVSFRVTILRDTQYTLYRIKWHGTVSYRPNIFCFFSFLSFFSSFPGVSTLPYGTAHTALRGHAMSSMSPPSFLSSPPPLCTHNFFILSVIPFVTFTRLSI